MKLPPLRKAVFRKRINRFVCSVEVDGRSGKALLRNTGRLRELLTPGREVYLRRKSSGKYAYEILLVRGDRSLVCVDSHMAPALFEEWVRLTGKPWPAEDVKRELRAGRSRFDLLLNGNILVEAKSVNLVKDGIALFPDAPTERGRRHIKDLMNLRSRFETCVVFVIQREDAVAFSPNYETDPEFGRLLEEFHRAGNTVKAYLCKVSLYEVKVWKEVPVVFNMTLRRW
ncbi:MAG: DNA/RNA nuclease SfsA [Aquificota bacterium]|nr:DNA/RNA nuclease SfsA [Aquificota bacterium]